MNATLDSQIGTDIRRRIAPIQSKITYYRTNKVQPTLTELFNMRQMAEEVLYLTHEISRVDTKIKLTTLVKSMLEGIDSVIKNIQTKG